MPRNFVVLALFGMAILGLAASARPALAGSGLPLFEDDFTASGMTWGQPNEQIHVGDGQLTITSEADRSYVVMERRRGFDAVEYSATARFVSAPDAAGGKAGLAFWMTDPSNYYLLQAAQDGKAAVYRLRNGAWTTVIEPRALPVLKSGLGAENRLTVVTKGPKASMLVNGADFVSITGQPPAGPRYIGLFGESPAEGVATVSFSDLSATLPDSVTAGTIFDGLVKDGLGESVPEGFTVKAVHHDLTPKQGLAEVSFDLTGSGGATGTLLYRFYESEAAANAYRGDDVRQPYADEVGGPGELLSLGHSNFEGDSTEYRWMWKMLPKPGAEWIRSIAWVGDLVVMATIELPRRKVRGDDELRDGSLERAIRADASAVDRAQAIEAAMPRP